MPFNLVQIAGLTIAIMIKNDVFKAFSFFVLAIVGQPSHITGLRIIYLQQTLSLVSPKSLTFHSWMLSIKMIGKASMIEWDSYSTLGSDPSYIFVYGLEQSSYVFGMATINKRLTTKSKSRQFVPPPDAAKLFLVQSYTYF